MVSYPQSPTKSILGGRRSGAGSVNRARRFVGGEEGEQTSDINDAVVVAVRGAGRHLGRLLGVGGDLRTKH